MLLLSSDFLKKNLSGTLSVISISNRLDPDQDQHFVGPDLVPNCLERLKASKERVQIPLP